ncbi:hypothetical protein [Methanobrevibacter sp.]|uniref:hypothetical protein n=1 Tax=Methanobrevibacter sp. TaxID=66852 RepID=UPI00386585A3
MTSYKPLTEKIPYKKAIWVFGFVKTNVSSVLISSGVTILLSSLLTSSIFHTYRYYGVILGATAILIGEIGTIAIDKWKIKDKKKELKIIDKHIEENKKEVLLEREELEKEAAKIAHDLIEKELEKTKDTL